MANDFIIEESSSERNTAESSLRILFRHMIKVEVSKNDQYADWVRSISEASKNLSSIKSHKIDKVLDKIQRIYENARKDAYNDFMEYKTEAFTDICPKDIPIDWANYNNLSNPEYMEQWMIDRAYSEPFRNALHLKGKHKDYYEDTKIKYTNIKQVFPGVKG